MQNIIRYKVWYFAFSLIIIIPGLVSLLRWGLDLSIDFTGGSETSYSFNQPVTNQKISEVINAFASEHVTVTTTQFFGNQLTVRTPTMSSKQSDAVGTKLSSVFGQQIKQDQFETIGPVIGSEITTNAFRSVVAASLLIVLYIALSFRKVPRPASSWRFGICAIIALIHDVLVLLGLFSLLGHFFHVEVDSLFVTAMLTVIGFSVHDTIVVFDRIRENLIRSGVSAGFAQVVNDAIVQTLSRSLNTSLTALLVLVSLLLFGGGSIRWFVVALIIGIVSGTYSSIFNATPLLVLWHEWDVKRKAAAAS